MTIVTALLDEFDCPPENPLSEDGRWQQTTPERPPLKKVTVSLGVCGATDSENNPAPNYSHWAQETFDSEKGVVEVWGCTTGGQLGVALETWRVALWSSVGSVTGYLLFYGGAISKGFKIRQYDGNLASFTEIASSAAVGYPERIGLKINGADIEGWGMYAGVWTLMCSAPGNTAYRGKFYLGLGIEDPTGGDLGFACLGGGVPRRTQFFRWLYN